MSLEKQLEEKFPIKPYDIQIQLAKEIYTSLQNKRKVTILESPTGSGKSFSVIVGVLGWLQDIRSGSVFHICKEKQEKQQDLPDWFVEQEYDEFSIPSHKNDQVRQKIYLEQKKSNSLKLDDKKQDNDEYLLDIENDLEQQFKVKLRKKLKTTKQFQIIYCSRTHTQIKQWVQELKKIPDLNKDITLISLSSRQQLCINDQIIQKSCNSGSKLNYLCKQNQKQSGKNPQCRFYKNYQDWKNNQIYFDQQNLIDIEDLKQLGKTSNVCPYYASKELVGEFDFVCLPYSILIEKLSIFQNPIVLIDEAHNFGNSVLQSKTAQISYQQLKTINEGLNQYKFKYHQRVKAKTFYFITLILNFGNQLLEYFGDQHKKLIQDQQPYIKIDVLTLLLKLNIQNIDLAKFLQFLDHQDMRRRIGGFIDLFNLKQNNDSQIFQIFESFCQLIKLILITTEKENILYIEKGDNLSSSILKIFAISNEEFYQNLIDSVRNLLLVGGTMHPLNELQVLKNKSSNDQYVFQAYPHVIPNQNCKVFIVKGYDEPIHFSFKQKKDNLEQLFYQTHKILYDIQSHVPDGIVVFLQSYSMLKQFETFLVRQNKQKNFNKKLFWDQNIKNQTIFTDYQKCINNKQKGRLHIQNLLNLGGILFSVVGGTLSEGINFSDSLCRAVVILGVPFANYQSIEIQELMKRNTDGRNIYENIAMKGVNQSVGRSIRHINDYALIYLVDSMQKIIFRKQSKGQIVALVIKKN